MSYQAVKSYFEHAGIVDHITEHQQTGDTVEHAAETIGCTVAEIAKAMSFLVDGKPVMVVMAGDTKVNSSKFKAYFHQKPTMIPWDQVEELIGHAPGGVCPFAVIHTAAGIDMATIRVTMEELIEHSHCTGWVDVCKGWLVNEAAS